MRRRKCENCVNGHGTVGFRVYCSKHHKETKDDSVCPDHRFIEEEFDLSSATPFTDWLKKQGVRTLPKSLAPVCIIM